MGAYEDRTRETIDRAVTWAGESARFWLESCVRLVDRAGTGATTAESSMQDASALFATGARDMARIWATWIAMGQALIDVPVGQPGEGGQPPGGGQGGGNQPPGGGNQPPGGGGQPPGGNG